LFYQPIRKNKITFFKQEEISGAASSKEKTLKEDCHLFSQLYISCQSRQCDLHKFFRNENQSAPASLSDSGKLHTCQKSQLGETVMPNTEPEADAIIIDGSALANSQPPRTSKTLIILMITPMTTSFQELDHILPSTKDLTLCLMCIRSPA